MGVEQYKIILDVPAKNPTLGFSEYADALTQIIEKSDPRFAIGIFGTWGTGKTTLMELIESKLNKRRAICVRFNAWRYEREEHLIVPLLDTIRQALVDWKGDGRTAKKAKSTARIFGKVTKALLHGFNVKLGIPNALEVTFEASKALSAYEDENTTVNEASKKKFKLWSKGTPSSATTLDEQAHQPHSFYHACFSALGKAIEDFVGKSKRRIVVFVDDLDRCLPDGALSVLESMKLFFDLPGFIFVVGLDRRVVESCIDSRYQQERTVEGGNQEGRYRVRGEDYIKKIFQVPFTLSPVDAIQLQNFLDSIKENAGLEDDQITDLETNVRPHLDYLVTDDTVNPREIKRFINVYTLQVKTDSSESDRAIVLTLHTVAFRRDWRSAYEALLFYGPVFVDAIQRFLDDDTNALRDLELNIPQSFIRYVSSGAPGNALLTTPNLDYFIHRAEATRSESDTSILPIIQDCASLRTLQRDLANQDKSVADILTEMVERLSKVFEHTRSLPECPQGGAVKRSVSELLNRVQATQGNPSRFEGTENRETLAAWNKENNTLITQILESLMSLFRGSSQIQY